MVKTIILRTMSNTYWLNGKYVQKEDAYLSPLTLTLHYGLGAFEGVRSYEAKNGEVNIFRLKVTLLIILDVLVLLIIINNFY